MAAFALSGKTFIEVKRFFSFSGSFRFANFKAQNSFLFRLPNSKFISKFILMGLCLKMVFYEISELAKFFFSYMPGCRQGSVS